MQCVFEKIIENERIADIGCDHGALACKAVAEKNAYAIAGDISQKSLAKCAALAKKYELTHSMDFRVGDGLSTLKNHEVDTVIICGMGSKEMIHILDSAPYRYERYLFLAHNKWHLLRKYCMEHGLTLTYEKLLKDRNHFYFLMEFGQGKCQLSEKEILLGTDIRSQYYKIFVQTVKNKAKKVLNSENLNNETKKFFRKILELCKEGES